MTIKFKLETYKAVAFSTAHITESDNKILSLLAANDQMIFERDSGYIIKLYSDLDTNLENFLGFSHAVKFSEEFINLITVSHNNGFMMIELDSDAPIYNTYKTFEW